MILTIYLISIQYFSSLCLRLNDIPKKVNLLIRLTFNESEEVTLDFFLQVSKQNCSSIQTFVKQRNIFSGS